MKILKLFLICFLFCSIDALAYFQRHEAGQEVFSFSSTFHSPRNTATEHSNAAEQTSDPGITLLNPAALRLQDGKKNTAAIYWQTGDLAENQGLITYARALSTITVQASYGWISYGGIDGIDEYGEETGVTHEPLSQLVALSAMVPLKHINVGASIKLATDKLSGEENDRTAMGLAFDWGISWIAESRLYGITIAARDFGAMIRDYVDDNDDETYAMAQVFAISGFLKPRTLPRLALYAESSFPRYAESALHLGAEYSLSQYFFIRGGFTRTWLDLSRDAKELFASNSRPGESNEARLFSLGLGYALGPLALDYAFSYLTQGIGTEHRIGVRFSF